MASEYTPKVNLYVPNVQDKVDIISSMADNFKKIDDAFKNLKGSPIVNVMDFGAKGDGVTDDTKAFNDAINSLTYGGLVFVPPATYMINAVGYTISPDYATGGIKMKNNITLMAYGAKLCAIPNNSRGYCVVNFSNCANARLIGAEIYGERYDHTNSSDYVNNKDQWGNGVMFIAAEKCGCIDVKVMETNGDGFCIGSDSYGTPSYDTFLLRCYTNDARRNGLSVISAVGGVIQDCIFENTNGTSPECGVDLEPNPSRTILGIKFINCKAFGNNQHGFLLAAIQSNTRSADNAVFIGCEAAYNGMSGWYSNLINNCIFIGNTAHDNAQNGFAQVSTIKDNYNYDAVYKDNIAYKNGYHGFMIGASMHGAVDNNYAYDNAWGYAGTDIYASYDNFNFYELTGTSIRDNKARMTAGKKVRYAMLIVASCDKVFATNNDLFAGGTYGFNNASSSTVKGAGNRGLDGATFSTADWL